MFLENSPQVICDQILWLVKNASLDFEVKETPYSLNLSVKKRFAQHWKSADQQQSQRIYSPAPKFKVPTSCQVFQDSTEHQNASEEPQETENLRDIINVMKKEKDDLEKEVVTCELKQKKLKKECSEIQSKHEKVCHDLKAIKSENEVITKQCNAAFSVALKSYKKDLKDGLEIFEEKLNIYKVENDKLNIFKNEKVFEERKRKKGS